MKVGISGRENNYVRCMQRDNCSHDRRGPLVISMSAKRLSCFAVAVALASPWMVREAPAAEAAVAVPAKNVSLKEREANKRVVAEFFRPGITAQERYALLDDGYIQHNPMAKKMADRDHLSYKDSFLKMLQSMGGSFPKPPSEIDGVKVPEGNMLYMELAEGDLVFVMRQEYRRDPTEKTVVFYPSYGWDVFRVRNGKLYEHWDGATIMAGRPGAASDPASDDPMEAFYENTMISVHPDGGVYRAQFNRDGTYVVWHEGKIDISGSYKVSDGKLCMVMNPSKPPACHPFASGHKVGDSWSENTQQGLDKLSLEAGRNH